MTKLPNLFGLAFAPLAFLAIARAQAYVTTPVLVPAHARPGQTVSVEISHGVCDALLEYNVTRVGNAVHVEFNSFHATTFDWCIYSPVTFAYAIGNYEAGTYTVQVDRHYQGFFGNLIQEPLATLSLVVGADPIPSMGSISVMTLILGLVMLSWRYRDGQGALPRAGWLRQRVLHRYWE